MPLLSKVCWNIFSPPLKESSSSLFLVNRCGKGSTTNNRFWSCMFCSLHTFNQRPHEMLIPEQDHWFLITLVTMTSPDVFSCKVTDIIEVSHHRKTNTRKWDRKMRVNTEVDTRTSNNTEVDSLRTSQNFPVYTCIPHMVCAVYMCTLEAHMTGILSVSHRVSSQWPMEYPRHCISFSESKWMQISRSRFISPYSHTVAQLKKYSGKWPHLSTGIHWRKLRKKEESCEVPIPVHISPLVCCTVSPSV